MRDYFQKRPAASNSDLRAQVWFLREKRTELILQLRFFAVGWKSRSLRLSVTRPRGNESTDEFVSARKSRNFKAAYWGHRLTVPLRVVRILIERKRLRKGESYHLKNLGSSPKSRQGKLSVESDVRPRLKRRRNGSSWSLREAVCASPKAIRADYLRRSRNFLLPSF